MRGGVVAGGVALIIVGIIFFFMSNTDVGFFGGPGGGAVGYSTEQQIFLMVGVGLGIVGFIVLIAGLAASKKEKPAPLQTVVVQPSAAPKEPEVLVVCPECGARVSSRSKFCPECGEDLGPKLKTKSREIEVEEAKAPKAVKVVKPSVKARYCMGCGTELPEGSDFCPECGKGVKKVK